MPITETAFSKRVARRRRMVAVSPGRRELALFLAIYLLYDAMRWIFAGHAAAARRHAHWVIHLERTLHISVEGSVQHALGFGVPGSFFAYVYLAAQLVVMPGALIWLYRRAPHVYRPLRNTVVGMWLISIPVFALYPVAPPRLAGIGIADTVGHRAGVGLTGHSTMFYNPYASVPSLHVGLAFAIGIALAAALHHRAAKLIALGWGPLVALAVVATGNHYLFDVATGVLLAATCYLAFATSAPSTLAHHVGAFATTHLSIPELDHARTQPLLDPHPVRMGSDAQRRPGAHPLPWSGRPAPRPALRRRSSTERVLGEPLSRREGAS